MDDSRRYIVYCYTNNINGKKYVGQTCHTLLERSKKDGSGYNHCTYFYHAIQKYGFDNFSATILAENLSKEDADIIEKKYIDLWNLKDHRFGYNLRDGGSNGALTDNHKRKIGEANKNPSCETRERLRNCRLGQKLSNETKKKIGDVHRGRKQSQDHIDNRIKKITGQKRTDEQKQNISKSLKGKKFSPEHAKKCGEKHRKEVLELDKNNNIVNMFDSARSAALHYGLHEGNVSRCCRRGNGATTGGKIFVYKKDFLKEECGNVLSAA